MRRFDKEIRDEKLIETILQTSDICYLGLWDKQDTYVVPVNYGYAANHLYIHSAAHGRKIDIIKENPKVSFTITHSYAIQQSEVPCRWSSKYRSVMGLGRILIETDPETKKKALDLLMRKYDDTIELEYDSASLSRVVILTVEITALTGKQSGSWD